MSTPKSQSHADVALQVEPSREKPKGGSRERSKSSNQLHKGKRELKSENDVIKKEKAPLKNVLLVNLFLTLPLAYNHSCLLQSRAESNITQTIIGQQKGW